MSTKTKTETEQLDLSAMEFDQVVKSTTPERRFNGVNSNYIPPRAKIVPIPEQDCFDIDETETDVVVRRKSRESSVDLGTVEAYSLRAMRNAGVEPASLKINTSPASRLDGMSALDKFSSAAEKLESDNNPDKTE